MLSEVREMAISCKADREPQWERMSGRQHTLPIRMCLLFRGARSFSAVVRVCVAHVNGSFAEEDEFPLARPHLLQRVTKTLEVADQCSDHLPKKHTSKLK